MPCEWREDPRWRGRSGGGSRRQPAHRADYPSRWLPARRGQLHGGFKEDGGGGGAPEGEVHVIDHLVVPRRRPGI